MTEIMNKNNVDDIFSSYEFSLDDFQKDAIIAVENGENALVMAPTGAGKTLTGEYCIKKFCRNGKKVLYTVPIKALANEKLYDLSTKYSDISFGIITGDISDNPIADCLIMTTEILWKTIFQQRMLKNNTELNGKIKLHFEFDIDTEVAAVIFDEAHMLGDRQRGTVWEESIKELKPHVIKVLLSATLGNPEKITEWIGNTKICKTTIRKVPLFHNFFYAVPDSFCKKVYDKRIKNKLEQLQNQLLLVKSHNLDFQDNIYHDISSILYYMETNRMRINRTFAINKLIQYLFDNDLLPSICVVMSKRLIEKYSNIVNICLFKDTTKIATVEKKCRKILSDKLSNYKEYLELPEYKQLIKLLEKGVATHHAGMLPVLRELVEQLHDEGYVKLLFATETVLIGINKSNRSVVYTSMSKYENGFRNFKPSEYIQGAGRAGRRGKDDKGVVIHLLNMFDLPDIQSYRTILSNRSRNISSQFKIDFNLILKLVLMKQNPSDYISNTLYNFSIKKESEYIQSEINNLNEVLNKKETGFQYKNTPDNVLNEYSDMKEMIEICSRKQKKKLERKVQFLEDEHKHLKKDFEKLLNIKNVKKNIKKYDEKLHNLDTSVDITIKMMYNELKTHHFLEEDHLTTKGIIASNINEVNCLVMSEIVTNGLLQDLSTIEIICILSCFTNVYISDENKNESISQLDIPDKIKEVLYKIKNINYKYLDIEQKFLIDNSEQYTFHYELCDIIYEWCDSQNNFDSNYIFNKCKEKNISTGQFTKCILKINNIANELEKSCLVYNNIDLMEKLSKIGESTLKSVATNQSLYV